MRSGQEHSAQQRSQEEAADALDRVAIDGDSRQPIGVQAAMPEGFEDDDIEDDAPGRLRSR